MIVVQLCGGLGNQLFQYALGRTLALKYNTDLRFDTSLFAGAVARGETPRSYRLEHYQVKGRPLDKFTNLLLPPFPRRVPKWLSWCPRWPGMVKRVSEQGHGFNPSVMDCGRAAYLAGYWQTERYFERYAEHIRADLQLKEPLSVRRQEIIARIGQEEAVSIHVRRGDYVTNPNASAYHGTCSAEWYDAAISEMRKRTRSARFFVFSDDPAWVRDHLNTPADTVFIDPQDDDREYEDLHLMSKCRHHIVANSSFSWWGAWLNASPEKIVIAPKQWFLAEPDPGDRIPASWIRL